MHGRGGDAERALGGHAGFLGPLDGGNDVAHIVQSVEDAGDIGALGMFHLIHKCAHVIGHGIHAEGVQSAVEHVGLDAHLVERLTECTDSFVGVLAGQEVHLLKGATIGFHTGETAHVDDNGGDAGQLVFAWLELTGTLPHVSVNETELNFLCHISIYSDFR